MRAVRELSEYPVPDYVAVVDRWGPLPRILTREAALARGYSRRAIEHRLARGRWRRVLPGVYRTGDTLTWDDRLVAALALAGPAGLLTGAAALADVGLRCVDRPHRVLVLVPRACRVRPAGWVRIRRTDRMPLPAQAAGPRRAELARSVADLALETPRLDDVRTLVAQTRRAGLCTLEQLQRELVAGPRRGSRNLRLAIADVAGGAWSAPEAEAAAILRASRYPDFEQNARIVLPGGAVLYADFLWRRLRAVLEIDSDEHHYLDPVDRDATAARSSLLQTCGYTVMSRRPAVLTRSPARFRRDVESWLEARERRATA
jgi:very-short-patch-repair endonuclease